MNIDNPHDKLPPETSKDIIIAHTADGAKILKKHKMPKKSLMLLNSIMVQVY